jgi:hypothetical protein
MPAQSIYNSILTAVQQAVEGLTLELGAATLPVVIRKLPKVQEPLDTVPCVLVVPAAPEQVEVANFEGLVYVWYTVGVVVVAANNQDFSSNLDSYLSWREQIRRLFQAPSLPGVSQVWDTEVHPEPVIDPEAVNADYDYSGLTLRFRTVEPRD